jgi:hypothetical protein
MGSNIQTHIDIVARSNFKDEIRVLKLWRNQHNIDFPSFYLELTTINALTGRYDLIFTNLATRVRAVFESISGSFVDSRVVDPANSNNIISDDLSISERRAIRNAANIALSVKNWGDIVR